jgi:dephospho-CoA kinase
MHIIGLTGGYCTGKNEVAKILTECGWQVVDVDKLGHAALALSSLAIRNAFGPAVMNEDGSVNRTKLGQIVFSNAQQMQILESLVHPAMLTLLDREIQSAREQKKEKFCINAALLYRFPQLSLCEAVIEVHAPLFLRVLRAKKRDNLSAIRALQRIFSQRELWKLRPRKKARVLVLLNSGNREQLEKKTKKLIGKISQDLPK